MTNSTIECICGPHKPGGLEYRPATKKVTVRNTFKDSIFHCTNCTYQKGDRVPHKSNMETYETIHYFDSVLYYCGECFDKKVWGSGEVLETADLQ